MSEEVKELFVVENDEIMVEKPVMPEPPAVDTPRVGPDLYEDEVPATEPVKEKSVDDKATEPEKEKEPEKPAEKVETTEPDKTKPERKSLLDEPEPVTVTQTELDADPTYKGKSAVEIAQMHREAVKKMSQMGDELGKLRGTEKEPSFEEVAAKMSSKDVLLAAQKLREQLSEIDPVVDVEQYKKVTGMIAQTDVLYAEKRQDELFREQVNSRENASFKTAQKESMQKSGMLADKDGNFSESEFGKVMDNAVNYVGDDGKLTESAVYKSLIDLYGHQKVTKFFELLGAENTRKQIAESAGKQDIRIDTTKAPESSLTGSRVRFDDMSPAEQERFLDKLSVEELNSFETALKRKQKVK
jgi:hypothetical protein